MGVEASKEHNPNVSDASGVAINRGVEEELDIANQVEPDAEQEDNSAVLRGSVPPPILVLPEGSSSEVGTPTELSSANQVNNVNEESQVVHPEQATVPIATLLKSQDRTTIPRLTQTPEATGNPTIFAENAKKPVRSGSERIQLDDDSMPDNVPAELSTKSQEEHLIKVDASDVPGSAPPDPDLDAAIDFLRVLHRHHKWPQTRSALKTFLFNKFDWNLSSPLAVWLKRRRDVDRLTPNNIRTRLRLKLENMGWLKVAAASQLKWNRTAIKKTLMACGYSSPLIATKPTATTTVEAPIYVSDTPNKEMYTSSGTEITMIDTVQQLESLQLVYPFSGPNESTDLDSEKSTVAVDCEGVPEHLYLVQVATRDTTYIFDCVKLGPKTVCQFLHPFLSDHGVTKLFHDLHNDAAAFSRLGGVPQLCGTFDTQLAIESLTGRLHATFNRMLMEIGLENHATKHAMKEHMKSGQRFAQHPFPPDILKFAADDVRLLISARDKLLSTLGQSTWDAVQRASDTRALSAVETGGTHRICFDVANSYTISSYELLQEARPDDMLKLSALDVSNETDTLLSMLPMDLLDYLTDHTHELSDIVLDKGRAPLAWVGGSRVLLGADNRLVELSEIEAIVDKLGGFGTDNRAGLERQLHRISAIRNRECGIIGLTMRVGRHVSGNAGIISDLLFADSSKSILFLGEPGSGKTTVVREVARLLAERSNVCIVDTSNEIAGDGDIPHPCVGFSRRMMVPSLDKQSAVMIECVQNHTPEIMVIDEIGRSTEVEAARTRKNRGVRLIASAHGDLRKLIKNPKLRGLIGGVESVTLGDEQAKLEAKKSGRSMQKVKAERAGPPTFDIIVELKRGAHHEWRIVLNSGEAVDKVLEGQPYQAQRRTRNPLIGAIQLDLELA